MSKKILVTGGAGFIGSSMVRELLKEKANVIVYDNFLSGSKENLKEVSKETPIKYKQNKKIKIKRVAVQIETINGPISNVVTNKVIAEIPTAK